MRNFPFAILATIAALPAFSGYKTNVWTKAGSGIHSLGEAANWQGEELPDVTGSVTNVLDFSGLASGAIVSNGWKKEIRTAAAVFGNANSTSTDTWEFRSAIGTPFYWAKGEQNNNATLTVNHGKLISGWSMTPWNSWVDKLGDGIWCVTADSWNMVTLNVREGELQVAGTCYQTKIRLGAPNACVSMKTNVEMPIAALTMTKEDEGQKFRLDAGSAAYVGAAAVKASEYDTTFSKDVLAGTGAIAPINTSTMRVNSSQPDFEGAYRIMNSRTVVRSSTSDILAFYRFEGATSEFGEDSSVNNHPLKSWHWPLMTVDAERGHVIHFASTKDKEQELLGQDDASGGLATAPLGNDPFTVALWMKVDAAAKNQASIFYWGKIAGNGQCAFLCLQKDGKGTSGSGSTGNTGYLRFTNYGNATYFGDESVLSGWHHVTIVNGTNGVVRCYVDGELAATNTTLTERNIQSGPFYIALSSANWSYFDGYMDDFVIVRGEADPRRLMNLTAKNIASFGTPLALNPSVRVEGNHCGSLAFEDGAHTIGGLSGAGVFSDVHLSGDLTVNRANGEDNFRSCLKGEGGLVKRGSDYTLRLSSPQEYVGETRVEAGTLELCGFHSLSSDCLGEWLFDSESLGYDTGSTGKFTLKGSNDKLTAANDADRGKVLYVDGTGFLSSYSYYPAGFPSNALAHGYSFWFKSAAGCESNAGLLVWGKRKVNGKMHMIRLNGDKGFVVSHYGDNWEVGGKNFGDGVWHHIAYSFADGKQTLWIDGVSQGEINASPSIDLKDASFIIGAYPDGKYAKGFFDDVRFRARALTEAEVLAEYASKSHTSYDVRAKIVSPILKWDFEDPSNPGLNSVGGEGNSLTSVGEVSVVEEPGRSGHVLDLTSSTMSYLVADTFPVLAPVDAARPAGSRTLTAWFKATPASLPRNKSDCYAGILDFGDSTNFNLLALQYEHRKSPTYQINSWYRTRATWFDAVSGSQSNVWHHLAAVRDASTGACHLYLDGSLLVTYNAGCHNYPSGNSFFYIGRTHFNATESFRGYLDDVEIYDIALSAEQISELCLAGSEKSSKPNRLPVGTSLSVAAGATVDIRGTEEHVSVLSGEGTIDLSDTAKITADSIKFSGVLKGKGSLNLVDEVVIPCDASLSALPLVVSDEGKVVLPSNLTIAIDSPARNVAGGLYTVAKAGELVLPGDFSGWKVTTTKGAVSARWVVIGGEVKVRIGSGFSVIIR